MKSFDLSKEDPWDKADRRPRIKIKGQPYGKGCWNDVCVCCV